MEVFAFLREVIERRENHHGRTLLRRDGGTKQPVRPESGGAVRGHAKEEVIAEGKVLLDLKPIRASPR